MSDSELDSRVEGEPIELLGSAGSLAAKVAQRREERARKRGTVLTVAVPGFEDLFAASYRRLKFEEKRTIAYRHKGVGEDAADEVGFAADLLINACLDLLEVTGTDESGKPTYRSLGKRWSSTAVTEICQVPLPEKCTARQALIAAFDSEDLINHLGLYIGQSNALDDEDREALPGEFVPSAEG